MEYNISSFLSTPSCTTMFSASKFTFLCSLVFITDPIFSQQSYDKSSCTSQSLVQGSKYNCSSNNLDCTTFVVYRAQQNFNTISSIASLFNISQSDILTANHLTENDSRSLSFGREIFIPITCHCHGGFFHAFFMYNFSSTDSVDAVACGVLEGLIKAQTLAEANHDLRSNLPGGYLINVPIRCACPDSNQKRSGVNYLVTYPIMEADHTNSIASKFNVPEKMIWDANRLGPYDTVYPKTVLLVPTKDVPNVNWDIGSVPPNSPSPKSVIPVRTVLPADTESPNWNSHVFLGTGVGLALVTTVVSCTVFIKIRRQNHPRSFQPLSARSSVSTNVSPDFLDEMSKLKNSLINYSLEEIRTATDDFDEALMISTSMYHGRIGDSCIAIEQMDSEEVARNVIYILTTINHLNILRPEGFCYGSKPYLVFEFAENGSLWHCLSNVELDRQLTWARRRQIAFDLAAALHYLHNSTSPAFVHNNINSSTVLITMDWRAKLSGFSLAKPIIDVNKKDFRHGQEFLKVDVFAFGVVLLELLSAKEVITDGKNLTDTVKFLLDGGLVSCSQFLEKFKALMDPVLEGDYLMQDAICMVLLAKSCIENDPDHRPTMNDVLIALSKIV